MAAPNVNCHETTIKKQALLVTRRGRRSTAISRTLPSVVFTAVVFPAVVFPAMEFPCITPPGCAGGLWAVWVGEKGGLPPPQSQEEKTRMNR